MQRFLIATILVLGNAHCMGGELSPLESAAPAQKRAGDAGVSSNDHSTAVTGNPSSVVSEAAEVCNGLDENGDGQVDEGCSCVSGQTQACFPAAVLPSKSKGVDQAPELLGICATGTQHCQVENGSEFGGHFGPCQGAQVPQAEICGDGIDQDCDGADLKCDCTPSCAGKICGDNGCGGHCGSPPHACQTTTQQKKMLMHQFFECLGCCERDGMYTGQGLRPCSTGSDVEAHYYGGHKIGKLPPKPPYCVQEDPITAYPPCAGVAGAEVVVSNVALHIGSCEDKDPGVHELTYQRTCSE